MLPWSKLEHWGLVYLVVCGLLCLLCFLLSWGKTGVGQEISISTVFWSFFDVFQSVEEPFFLCLRMSEILNMELTFWKTGEQYGFHALYEEVKSEDFAAVLCSACEKDLPSTDFWGRCRDWHRRHLYILTATEDTFAFMLISHGNGLIDKVVHILIKTFDLFK